jgi:hypothetical protein
MREILTGTQPGASQEGVSPELELVTGFKRIAHALRKQEQLNVLFESNSSLLPTVMKIHFSNPELVLNNNYYNTFNTLLQIVKEYSGPFSKVDLNNDENPLGSNEEVMKIFTSETILNLRKLHVLWTILESLEFWEFSDNEINIILKEINQRFEDGKLLFLISTNEMRREQERALGNGDSAVVSFINMMEKERKELKKGSFLKGMLKRITTHKEGDSLTEEELKGLINKVILELEKRYGKENTDDVDEILEKLRPSISLKGEKTELFSQREKSDDKKSSYEQLLDNVRKALGSLSLVLNVLSSEDSNFYQLLALNPKDPRHLFLLPPAESLMTINTTIGLKPNKELISLFNDIINKYLPGVFKTQEVLEGGFDYISSHKEKITQRIVNEVLTPEGILALRKLNLFCYLLGEFKTRDSNFLKSLIEEIEKGFNEGKYTALISHYEMLRLKIFKDSFSGGELPLMAATQGEKDGVDYSDLYLAFNSSSPEVSEEDLKDVRKNIERPSAFSFLINLIRKAIDRGQSLQKESLETLLQKLEETYGEESFNLIFAEGPDGKKLLNLMGLPPAFREIDISNI